MANIDKGVMSTKPLRRRVRVVKDQKKHAMHQWRKVGRRILVMAMWGAVVVVSILVIWMALETMFGPRAMSPD